MITILFVIRTIDSKCDVINLALDYASSIITIRQFLNTGLIQRLLLWFVVAVELCSLGTGPIWDVRSRADILRKSIRQTQVLAGFELATWRIVANCSNNCAIEHSTLYIDVGDING